MEWNRTGYSRLDQPPKKKNKTLPTPTSALTTTHPTHPSRSHPSSFHPTSSQAAAAPLVASTPAVVVPTPAVMVPTPAVVVPTPAVVVPTPAVVVPTPAVVFPTPAVAAPTPSAGAAAATVAAAPTPAPLADASPPPPAEGGSVVENLSRRMSMAAPVEQHAASVSRRMSLRARTPRGETPKPKPGRPDILMAAPPPRVSDVYVPTPAPTQRPPASEEGADTLPRSEYELIGPDTVSKITSSDSRVWT